MLGSSNQNVGLFEQFTYSTSNLPCLLWTILQDWVSPFMFILIKLPTLNILMLKMGHIRAQVLITSVPRSWHGWTRDRFWNKGSLLEGRLIRAQPEMCSRQSAFSGLRHTMGTNDGMFCDKRPACVFSYHAREHILYKMI